MRVILRKERPHPGAQLRITDADGHRLTAFATNTAPGGPGRQLADLELRHRRRARAEDRFRCAKDTGLTNLPLHELDQNRIWCALVALACEITTWAQLLALTEHPARRWEPKRLRIRIFSIAARLARSGRQTVLHLSAHAPWAGLLLDAITARTPAGLGSSGCTRMLPAGHRPEREPGPHREVDQPGVVALDEHDVGVGAAELGRGEDRARQARTNRR